MAPSDDHGPELDFGGRKYGWALRYRKSGKTLVTLYPERNGAPRQVALEAIPADQMLSGIVEHGEELFG